MRKADSVNKAAIIQTAVCTVEDDLFVFESPLLPDCIGAAKTEKEAWAHFNHHVDTAYSAYLEGRLL
jgi:predicted RNase H-like HicB family nuclease